MVAVACSYSGEHATGLISWTRFLEASYYHLKQKALVNSFITANFAMRRRVFEEVGGFPKAWFGEDLMLGIKLKAKGLSVLWLPDLLVGQYFRPTVTAYVRQQFHWSSAVALISAKYPQTQTLTWSVKRGSLLSQLILEAGLLISPLFLEGAVFVYFLVFGLLGLLGLNLPFLIYVSKKRSLGTAIGIWMVTLFGRNPAWLSGCLWALFSHPRVMLSGLAKMVWRGAPIPCREGEAS